MNKNGIDKTAKKGPAKSLKIDWTKIKAEYVTGELSVRELAQKYGVSESAAAKHCASENWQKDRQTVRKKNAETITEKLNSEKVKHTVKDIDRVVSVASKLIKKLNRAVNELDRGEQIKRQRVITKTMESDGGKTVDVEQTTEIERERFKKLVDTKKAEQISKSLLHVKEILTNYEAESSDKQRFGIIEIPAQIIPALPIDEPQTEGKNFDE